MRTRYNDYWLYVEAEADDELRRLAAEARDAGWRRRHGRGLLSYQKR